MIGVQSNHGVEYFGGPASPRLFTVDDSQRAKRAVGKVFEKRAGVFMRVPNMQGRSPSYVNQVILLVMKFLAIILPHESSVHYKIEIFSHHFTQ